MLSLQTVIKIKAKEVYQAECLGKRFQDIEFSDEIIGKIYGIRDDKVFSKIASLTCHYHTKTALREHRVNELRDI